jgi:hypothetical protein
VKVLAIAALVLLLAGCAGLEQGVQQEAPRADTQASKSETTATEPTAATSELRALSIQASGRERVKVRVEIADEPDEQAKGLMDRTALGEERGMLFVFPSAETRSFWMQNTLIPLSIAYIDAEGRIVDIQDMKPLDDDPPHYVSAAPAQYALEVNKGFFDEGGVEVGDRVDLPV